MVDIRIFIFNNSLKQVEIPYFRAAVSKHLGGDVLLHNHTEGGLRNKLPLIQYKIIQGKPAIVAINEGISVVEPIMEIGELSVNIGKRPMRLNLDSVWGNQFEVGITEQKYKYSLVNWISFNEENYAIYKKTDSIIERLNLVTSILKSNILSFAKGIGVFFESQVELSISDISAPKNVAYKGTKLITFDVTFTCNVCLPEYIGLGKAVSRGYGMLTLKK